MGSRRTPIRAAHFFLFPAILTARVNEKDKAKYDYKYKFKSSSHSTIRFTILSAALLLFHLYRPFCARLIAVKVFVIPEILRFSEKFIFYHFCRTLTFYS